ncbi:hypothetical protein Tco_1363059 [Tanacetum coccineum]
MMSFLTAVVTSRYPTTNNQLRTSSNPRQQATIYDGKVTVQPVQGRQTIMMLEPTRKYTLEQVESNTEEQWTVILFGFKLKQCGQALTEEDIGIFGRSRTSCKFQTFRQVITNNMLCLFKPMIWMLYDLICAESTQPRFFMQSLNEWYSDELTRGCPNRPLVLDSGMLEQMTVEIASRSPILSENSWVQLIRKMIKVAKIMGFGDYLLGNVTISRVYFVEGLRHNLFSYGINLDSNSRSGLFVKHTCFMRNLEASKISLGYGIVRTIHLNFGAINHLDETWNCTRTRAKILFFKHHLYHLRETAGICGFNQCLMSHLILDNVELQAPKSLLLIPEAVAPEMLLNSISVDKFLLAEQVAFLSDYVSVWSLVLCSLRHLNSIPADNVPAGRTSSIPCQTAPISATMQNSYLDKEIKYEIWAMKIGRGIGYQNADHNLWRIASAREQSLRVGKRCKRKYHYDEGLPFKGYDRFQQDYEFERSRTKDELQTSAGLLDLTEEKLDVTEVKTDEPKALVSVDSMVNWSDHAAENTTGEVEKVYGMMAGLHADSADASDAAAEFAMMGISPKIALEEKIRVLSANLENTTNTLSYTEKLHDQAQKEKKEWEVKFEATLARFEKWKESSKNLKKLIDSSMSTRTKIGLGFQEYFGVDEVFDLSTPSVFYSDPVEKEVKPLYSRFVKAGEMHAVPPPIMELYASHTNLSLVKFNEQHLFLLVVGNSSAYLFLLIDWIADSRIETDQQSILTFCGWLNSAARPFFRPSSVYNTNWSNIYDPMIKGRWGTAVKTLAGILGGTYSNPRNPTNKWVADEKNRTFIEAARHVAALKLPTMFWTEDVSTAVIFVAEILCQAEAEIRNQGVSTVTDPAGIDSAVREPAGIVSADGVSTGSPSADSDPAGSNPADCFPPAGSVEPTDESNPAVSSSVSAEFNPVYADESLHFLSGQTIGARVKTYYDFPTCCGSESKFPNQTGEHQFSSAQILVILRSVMTKKRELKNIQVWWKVRSLDIFKINKRTNHTAPNSFVCLLASFSVLEPSSIATRLEDPDWLMLCIEEMQTVHSISKHSGRKKARLVARDTVKRRGIDYDELDVKGVPFSMEKLKKKCMSLSLKALKIFTSKAMYTCEEVIIDKTLFIKKDSRDIILVQVYVDDIIFGSTNKAWCDEFEVLMKGEFEMSAMGEMTFFLASRPDIMFAVSACSRHQVTPLTSHLNAVKKIFKYLKGQPKLGLWYPKDSPFQLEAYSDSDYAGSHGDRKSTTGGCQFLGRRYSGFRTNAGLGHWMDKICVSGSPYWDGKSLFRELRGGSQYCLAGRILPAASLVSAGSSMFLLVVILPAASLVSAGSSMFLLVVILPAASLVSAGSSLFLLVGFVGSMVLLVVILPAGRMVSAGWSMVLLVVIFPAARLVSAGWSMVLLVVIFPAARLVSAGLVVTWFCGHFVPAWILFAGSPAEAHPVPHPPPVSPVRGNTPERQPETEWVVPNPVSPGTDSGYVDPDILTQIILVPPPRIPMILIDHALEDPVIFGPIPRPPTILRSSDAAGTGRGPALLTSFSAKIDRCMGTKRSWMRVTVKQLRSARVGGDAPAQKKGMNIEHRERRVPLWRKRSVHRVPGQSSKLQPLRSFMSFVLLIVLPHADILNPAGPRASVSEAALRGIRMNSLLRMNRHDWLNFDDQLFFILLVLTPMFGFAVPDMLVVHLLLLVLLLVFPVSAAIGFAASHHELDNFTIWQILTILMRSTSRKGLSRVAAEPDSDDEILAEILFRGHYVSVTSRKHIGVRGDDILWDRPVEDFFSSESESDDDMENYSPPLPYGEFKDWEMVSCPPGNNYIHVYYQQNRRRKYFTYLKELLPHVYREDLLLLRRRMNRYFRLNPDVDIGLDLWRDVNMLCQSLHSDDVEDFWRTQDDWVVSSWKLYPKSSVHVLDLTDGKTVYMFVDKFYPIRATLLERMLRHRLTVPPSYCRDVVVAGSVIQTIQDGLRESYECLASAPIVDMVINPPWNLPFLGAKGLTSPEQTATGKGISNPLMAVMVCPKPYGIQLTNVSIWKLLIRDVAVSFDSAVHRDHAGSFDAAVLSLVSAACCTAAGYLVYCCCLPCSLFLLLFNPLASRRSI